MAARWPARSVACRAMMALCECPVAGGTSSHPPLGGPHHWPSPLCPACHPGRPAPGQQMQAVGGLCLCPGISHCRAAEQINLLSQSLLPPGSLFVLDVQTALAGASGGFDATVLRPFSPFPPFTSLPKTRGGAASTRAAEVPPGLSPAVPMVEAQLRGR